MNALSVIVGGALGAVCRYILGIIIMKYCPSPPFPVAMLIVNVIGSAGLGVFYGIYSKSLLAGGYEDPTFLLIGVGFFGAFTTFSTFSIESVQLLQRQRYKEFLLYIILSFTGCISLFIIAFLAVRSA